MDFPFKIQICPIDRDDNAKRKCEFCNTIVIYAENLNSRQIVLINGF